MQRTAVSYNMYFHNSVIKPQLTTTGNPQRTRVVINTNGERNQTVQDASVLNCDTLETNAGLVANTLMGRSQTMVSTSSCEGPCHTAVLSGLDGALSFCSAVFDVTNSKCKRHFSDTVNAPIEHGLRRSQYHN